jgi:hypothetical protein
MQHLAVVVFLFSSVAWASPVLTMGAGVEARLTRDVNPDVPNVGGIGQFYMSFTKHPWSVLWELGRSENKDSYGNYSIDNIEYTTMLWGRYEPWYDRWYASPYFGAGLGWQMNDVTSQFGAARDTRFGDGGSILGLSSGITSTLWQHWNVEGEVRLAKFEMQNGPAWSVLFRSGYTF